MWSTLRAIVVAIVVGASLVLVPPSPGVDARRPRTTATTRVRAAGSDITGAWFQANWGPIVFGPDDAWSLTVDPADPSKLSASIAEATGDRHVGVTVASPLGTTLAVGTYEMAVDASWRQAGEPGFAVDLQRCHSYGSTFTVHQVELVDGVVTAFAADFVFRCVAYVGQTTINPPSVWGSIRFHSSADYRAIEVPAWRYSAVELDPTLIGEWTDAPDLVVRAAGTLPVGVSFVSAEPADQVRVVSETCTGGAIPAGDRCRISYQVRPATYQQAKVTITIVHDRLPDNPLAVPILIRGVNIELSPKRLDFGSQELYTYGPAQTVTLRNGGSPLTQPHRYVTGGAEITHWGCPYTIPARATCTFTVALRPLTLGSHDGALSFFYPPDDPEARSIPITGTGVSSSAVDWPKPTQVSIRSWVGPDALAAVEGAWVQLARTTAWVGGRWVAPSGPHLGVLLQRRAETGGRWSSARRVNPASDHGDLASVAVSGSRVLVAWVHRSSLTGAGGGVAGHVEVRAVAGDGRGAFGPVTRLSPAAGRVGRPSIAASEAAVLVAWTDARTGAIRVARSTDGGATFAVAAAGTTRRLIAKDRSGVPSVAIDGQTAVLAWVADATGTVKGRISTDGGATWGAPEVLGSGAGTVSVALDAGLGAAAWATVAGVRITTWTGGTWTAVHTIKPPGDSPAYLRQWSATVAVLDGRVGVAWSGCRRRCDGNMDLVTSDLLWAESTDGGETFLARQVAMPGSLEVPLTPKSAFDVGIAWVAPGRRHLAFLSVTPGGSDIGVSSTLGTGSP